jgi:hypothetical protein
MKFKQPSLGTKAAIFLPFFTSWTRAHLRIAELGCLASIPLQWNKCTVSRSSKKKCWTKIMEFLLTSSQEQCPWHGTILQRVSSTHCPSDSSCKPCQPTFGSCGGSSTCDQLPYHVSSCVKQFKHRLQLNENNKYARNI